MSLDLATWLAANAPTPLAIGTLPLTTVARASAFLSPDQGSLARGNDAGLKRLISQLSTMFMQQMNRDTLARVDRTESYPSSRTGRIVLRNWPALSIGSCYLGGSASPAQGLALEPFRSGAQRVVASVGAGTLWGGADGVTISYQSGFVRYETVRVPATSQYTVAPENVVLVLEGAVDDLTGDSVPVTMNDDGEFVFEAASADRDVSVIYSYVPSDIEGAVIEEVALATRSRTRIGEVSKALPSGGGTSTFFARRLNDITVATLQPYRRVTP